MPCTPVPFSCDFYALAQFCRLRPGRVIGYNCTHSARSTLAREDRSMAAENAPQPPVNAARPMPRDDATLAAALAADVALFRGASDAPTIRLPDASEPASSPDAPPVGHKAAASSSLSDERSAATPRGSSRSSSPRNVHDSNDLPLDHDDRPQPTAWPSSPLKRRKGKDLPQNGDDRDDRRRKKRKTPTLSGRPKRATKTAQ